MEMEMNDNGSKLLGKRKLAAVLVFVGGVLFSSGILCYLGKISGSEYNAGLTTAGLAMMAYLGANAIQKFAKK